MSRAEKAAKDLLGRFYLDDPGEVHLASILGLFGIYYQERSLGHSQGNLVRYGTRAVINIDSNILSLGKKRFVISHELGHWILHSETKLFTCGEDDLNQWDPNTSRIEYEANDFAGNFLMPSEVFSSFCSNRPLTIDLILALRNRFTVSTTAASIRYTQVGSTPIMLLYSTDGQPKWYYPSRGFPFSFYGKDFEIPVNTLTSDFYKKGSDIYGTKVHLARTWFTRDHSVSADQYLSEFIISLPSFNSCLTYLSIYQV